jgi:hypothetical protein
MKTIYKLITVLLVLIGTVIGGSAQNQSKPWTEWSEREALKLLENSPWGKSQQRGEAIERHSTPLTTTDFLNIETFNAKSKMEAKLYARFLSAQPMRQAFARLVDLKQKTPDPELRKQLQSFVDRKFDDWIVIAVDYETSGKDTLPLQQAFAEANLKTLRNSTYLETKNGRLSLQQYLAPTSDGLGAKFIFPRMVNGQPFISADLGEVRFYSEITRFLSENMRFKVSEMMHDGKLEY